MLNINCEDNIYLKENDVRLETVDKFLYLGSIVSSDGGATIDITKRINKSIGG